MRVRDAQRSKLYKAENVLRLRTLGHRDFHSIAEIAIYVSALMIEPWFQKKFGKIAIPRVEKGRGSNATQSRMRIASWGYDKMVVLHELAHVIVRSTMSPWPPACCL